MRKFVISLLVAWLAVLACRVDSGPKPLLVNLGPKVAVSNMVVQTLKSDAANLTAVECSPCE